MGFLHCRTLMANAPYSISCSDCSIRVFCKWLLKHSCCTCTKCLFQMVQGRYLVLVMMMTWDSVSWMMIIHYHLVPFILFAVFDFLPTWNVGIQYKCFHTTTLMLYGMSCGVISPLLLQILISMVLCDSIRNVFNLRYAVRISECLTPYNCDVCCDISH